MSLRDYCAPRDHFDLDAQWATQPKFREDLSWPCCACTHNSKTDREPPCNICDHNANAIHSITADQSQFKFPTAPSS